MPSRCTMLTLAFVWFISSCCYCWLSFFPCLSFFIAHLHQNGALTTSRYNWASPYIALQLFTDAADFFAVRQNMLGIQGQISLGAEEVRLKDLIESGYALSESEAENLVPLPR